MKWIKTADRLPDDDKGRPYLVCLDGTLGKITLATFEQRTGWWRDFATSIYFVNNPSHWAEIKLPGE